MEHVTCSTRQNASSVTCKQGFTLIEIMVVVAITAILSGISMASFAAYSRKQALDSATTALAAGLRDARAETLASVGGSQYGIRVSSQGFTFFQGSVFSASATSNRPYSFSTYVLASSTQPMYVFQRLTGNAVASGTIDMYLSADSKVKKTIVIGATGLVDIQ